MPVMAMMGTPFSPEQLDEIRALSNQYGFTLREMDASVHYPADALGQYRTKKQIEAKL